METTAGGLLLDTPAMFAELVARHAAGCPAPELAARDAGRAGEVLAAVDVLCSFESFQLLVADQGLSTTQARSALVGALSALLAPVRAGRGNRGGRGSRGGERSAASPVRHHPLRPSRPLRPEHP